MFMLRDLRKKKGLTMKELGEMVGVAESTISQYETEKREPDFETLLKFGEIFDVPVDYLLRGDVYAGQKNNVPSTEDAIRVPVLGVIPAGVPIEAVEDILNYEELSTREFNPDFEYFGLRVQGNSMYPKYLDGDTVIIRKQPDCECGQDCVVYVNGYEATLKTIKKSEDGSLTLRPLNPEYPPRTYTPQEIAELPVGIYGVAVQIRRDV